MADSSSFPRHPQAQPFPDRPYFFVPEFLAWAGISRFLFYRLVQKKLIHPSKLAGRTVVTIQEACRWANSLPPMRPGNTQGTE